MNELLKLVADQKFDQKVGNHYKLQSITHAMSNSAIVHFSEGKDLKNKKSFLDDYVAHKEETKDRE